MATVETVRLDSFFRPAVARSSEFERSVELDSGMTHELSVCGLLGPLEDIPALVPDPNGGEFAFGEVRSFWNRYGPVPKIAAGTTVTIDDGIIPPVVFELTVGGVNIALSDLTDDVNNSALSISAGYRSYISGRPPQESIVILCELDHDVAGAYNIPITTNDLKGIIYPAGMEGGEDPPLIDGEVSAEPVRLESFFRPIAELDSVFSTAVDLDSGFKTAEDLDSEFGVDVVRDSEMTRAVSFQNRWGPLEEWP